MTALVAGHRRSRLPGVLPALDLYPHAGDPLLSVLAAQALEAAQAAGATYADVRFSLTRQEAFTASGDWPSAREGPPSGEHAAVGVRALVEGAWGFTAGPVWSSDEMARLGREATVQARINAQGRITKVELGERPPAVKGEWVTPVRIDPFTVPLAEKLATMAGLAAEASRLFSPKSLILPAISVEHRRQELTFASTDGAFITQTRYLSHPYLHCDAYAGPRTMDRLQPTAAGWEVMTDSTLLRDLPQIAEDAVLLREAERIEPNRYDVVFDGYTVGHILGRTVGMAAELDRVLGYEANATGTSYLAPPETTLGVFSFAAPGAPPINVVANRSQPGALSTIRWDGEGVAPDTYPVIQDGVLVDYHTTRELVPAMAGWYNRTHRPLHSHGCAGSQHAGRITMVQPPNLELKPSTTDTRFDELVAGLDHGLVVCGGTYGAGSRREWIETWGSSVTVDRQRLNGEVGGETQFVYEVKEGRRIRMLRGVECLFRAPELWKSLQALGGPSTQVTTGVTMVKGQPWQELRFSVTAPPARFKQIAVTDKMRKA